MFLVAKGDQGARHATDLGREPGQVVEHFFGSHFERGGVLQKFVTVLRDARGGGFDHDWLGAGVFD